jgi:hypothetical protein
MLAWRHAELVKAESGEIRFEQKLSVLQIFPARYTFLLTADKLDVSPKDEGLKNIVVSQLLPS